jgi:hypothetical protein
MVASPFAFYRGAAAIMAADLAEAPRTGLDVQLPVRPDLVWNRPKWMMRSGRSGVCSTHRLARRRSAGQKEIGMAIGPVEYIIVGFPGNRFNGEIAPELGKLVDSGTIRILDLVFITKDIDGTSKPSTSTTTTTWRCSPCSTARSAGSSATKTSRTPRPTSNRTRPRALLIWEDVWATPFVEALRASGAVLIEGSRIPHDLIEAAEAELAAAS